jgi:hypothetical protein
MFNAYGKDKGSDLTRLETWERIKESKGIESTELQEKPAIDENLIYLWNLFMDIKRGCESLTFNDLDAYQRVTGITLNYWEASIMLDLENLRISNG